MGQVVLACQVRNLLEHLEGGGVFLQVLGEDRTKKEHLAGAFWITAGAQLIHLG